MQTMLSCLTLRTCVLSCVLLRLFILGIPQFFVVVASFRVAECGEEEEEEEVNFGKAVDRGVCVVNE
jgi:hypothetical protein